MHRAQQLESEQGQVRVRGAAAAAPRTTPLTLVSGAVAGDDLEHVAGSAAGALGRPIAIAIPMLGDPVVQPQGSIEPRVIAEVLGHLEALTHARDGELPPAIGQAVPVSIGAETVGIVVALAGPEHPELRSWLDAAAAAAAVTAMLRHREDRDTEGSRKALLRMLIAASPPDLEALIAQASRLGLDLRQGAVALFARRMSAESRTPDDLQLPRDGLLADLGEGRTYGLLSLLPPADSDGEAEVLAADLRSRGMIVALSVRRDPAGLHDALREAELLVELAGVPDSSLYSHEETYRLLIGVLLRDPGELELLRAQTILPLTAYDSKHETELLATLQEFLIHHGSTTETAMAMGLHRHTVGYRLSRVQEVSGLSPYESDGRERLSLGLKAHQILEADERRAAR